MEKIHNLKWERLQNLFDAVSWFLVKSPVFLPEISWFSKFWSGMSAWPLTPLLHRPRYPPSRQLQLHLHLHSHPHTAEPRWPATWYIKWSPWECHYPLGWCWQWWFLFDPAPSTTSLSCAPNADTVSGPQQPRPEGAAYPIPLPSARDAHRESPTPSKISPH